MSQVAIEANEDWKKKFVDGGDKNRGNKNSLQKNDKSSIIKKMDNSVSKPIESRHPIDIGFGFKELNQRQQAVLNKLPMFGDRIIVNKRGVSMLDLAALTAKTGDEFAMFTRAGKRMIIRGNSEIVPLRPKEITELREKGYRWSGHTHPGYTDTDLIASDGDKRALELFDQSNSSIYNSIGRYKLIREE